MRGLLVCFGGGGGGGGMMCICSEILILNVQIMDWSSKANSAGAGLV